MQTMQNNVITRFFWALLPLLVVGCNGNAPQQNTAKEPSQASEDSQANVTSWHCEQGLQTWSCSRRTIADIQQREAQRKRKKFDWSQPQSTSPDKTGDRSGESDSVEVAVVESPAIAPTPASDNGTSEAVASYRPETPVSLIDLPSDYWAVQLIALSTQSELKAFMAELDLDELTGAMIEVNGRTYYVALLGVYETRAIAERAARNRPAALKGLEPYIRTMASLQSAMSRANAL